MEELFVTEYLHVRDDNTVVAIMDDQDMENELVQALNVDEVQKLHQWLGEWLAGKAVPGNYGRGQ